MTNERTNERTNEITTWIKIRQAVKSGFIKLKSGGVFDCSYPKSKLRRGRVQHNGDVSPTITTGGNAVVKIDVIKEENEMKKYAIRKLTPKECFRLMGVTEAQTERMLNKESNSRCYAAAGNSIVVPVLMALFSQLGIQNKKRWNELSLEEKQDLIYKGTVLEQKESDFSLS